MAVPVSKDLWLVGGTNLEFYLLVTLWQNNSCEEGVADLALH